MKITLIKQLQLKTGIASSVTIYALSKLPTIDNAVLNNNTVTWSGEDFDKFNSLTIYAEDSNNEVIRCTKQKMLMT